MKKLAILLALVALTSCTRPELTKRVLEDQGYTEIQITGWRPFQASSGGGWATGFEAKSPAGKRVAGTVTTGILKGSTIRLD